MRRVPLTLLVVLLVTSACQELERRPAGTDGSARWALEVARPRISAFAADAELRQILGTVVTLDGRLAQNAGIWSFIAWSASRKESIQVLVHFDARVTTSLRGEVEPGPGVARPLPADWVDSTEVFRELGPHLDPAATRAILVGLNVADYGGEVAGQAVWGASFDAGPNQLVLWNGKYVGPQREAR